MSKLSTPSMTSTFTSSSTSTTSSTFSSRPTSRPTYTPTSSFSSSPTPSFTFSSGPTFTPTPTILPIEVYYNYTVLPKPTFQPVYNNPSSSSTSNLEIAIILTIISCFIMCILCHISLTKSKRRLRQEAVARQELRLREEAVARSMMQQNPLYQV